MITVLGATGNVGSQVVRDLLADGVAVRAVARTAGRLAAATTAGAEPWAGDLTDTGFLLRAFDGAAAAFVLQPLDLSEPDHADHQRRVGESVVAALHGAGVGRVVALSSLGAEVPGGPGLAATGFLGALHEQERRLAELDARVTLLRPGMFLESFLPALGPIREDGVHHDSIDPDVALPVVATRDVGRAAVTVLRDPSAPRVVEVPGAADRTVPEVVAELGRALGVPDARYRRLGDPEMTALLEQVGLPADAARLQVAMNRAFNEGRVRAHQVRGDTAGLLTLEEWVKETVT
ncbi:NAD(P)H-binding protein [Pseudonocardia sp. NPDC049635]|uniref:NmrA family NAD(P)-binding protein n=1 Tax=Pseudonocardia sp. NPDC049635 TaxID=3155506 RepID=UPI0033E735AB